MADEDKLEVVRQRNEFYRDNYRRVLGILLIAILLIVGLMASLTYILTHPPAPQYFATDSTGHIIKLTPLDEPNLSKPALLEWASTAASAAFTYNAVNYRAELQAASEFFTPEGWQTFLKGLEESNNLNAVIAKKLIVSAVPTGTPIILQEGVINGRYAWRVRIPLLVTYESANQTSQQNLIVTMLITRVSPLVAPRGIGIAQFIATGGGEIGE